MWATCYHKKISFFGKTLTSLSSVNMSLMLFCDVHFSFVKFWDGSLWDNSFKKQLIKKFKYVVTLKCGWGYFNKLVMKHISYSLSPQTHSFLSHCTLNSYRNYTSKALVFNLELCNMSSAALYRISVRRCLFQLVSTATVASIDLNYVCTTDYQLTVANSSWSYFNSHILSWYWK